jgi:hypothetical protein
MAVRISAMRRIYSPPSSKVHARCQSETFRNRLWPPLDPAACRGVRADADYFAAVSLKQLFCGLSGCPLQRPPPPNSFLDRPAAGSAQFPFGYSGFGFCLSRFSLLPDRRPAFPLRLCDPGARGGRQRRTSPTARLRNCRTGGADAPAVFANAELPPDLSHLGF